MDSGFLVAARRAGARASPQPLYRRLADGLAEALRSEDGDDLPSARAFAVELGINRATVTAAYRELARRGLITVRTGRRGSGATPKVTSPPEVFGEPPSGALDLARWVPDLELLPPTGALGWLDLDDSEREAVAQYGDPWGWGPLREWLAHRLAGWGIASPNVLLTTGVQHGLDLLLRALVQPGDTILVEDPTYPGLPPLLALHRVRAVGMRVGGAGVSSRAIREALGRARPRLAILTPTLHNPSGAVVSTAERAEMLGLLRARDCVVVEELFEPGLVADGVAPPPLAAMDRDVVAVGSFSKVLFPGLRVGWMSGPPEIMERAVWIKRATDLSGSPFLEATAYTLSRRGELDAQIERLRGAAGERRLIVLEELAACPPGISWSEPRGGFSLVVMLPAGWSARAVAAGAARRGVWILPGPLMSVSGRDDVVRLAYSAAGGSELRQGVESFVSALRVGAPSLPLV